MNEKVGYLQLVLIVLVLVLISSLKQWLSQLFTKVGYIFILIKGELISE